MLTHQVINSEAGVKIGFKVLKLLKAGIYRTEQERVLRKTRFCLRDLRVDCTWPVGHDPLAALYPSNPDFRRSAFHSVLLNEKTFLVCTFVQEGEQITVFFLI